MRTFFITIGILLFLWGLAALMVVVQDIDAGASARPGQEIAYAAAFLASGGIFLLAGIRRYALNRTLIIGIALLHAAVYSSGVVIESVSNDSPLGMAIVVTAALFIGATIAFRRAHRAHLKTG
jgi:hypothetical protein